MQGFACTCFLDAHDNYTYYCLREDLSNFMQVQFLSKGCLKRACSAGHQVNNGLVRRNLFVVVGEKVLTCFAN
jgi:hypothetical protein